MTTAPIAAGEAATSDEAVAVGKPNQVDATHTEEELNELGKQLYNAANNGDLENVRALLWQGAPLEWRIKNNNKTLG